MTPALTRGLAAPLLALALGLVPGRPSPSDQAPAPAGPPQALATFDAAWRIVRDTHFDPTFNGVDWDGLRDELRPRAATARSVTELRAIVQAMLDRLGQSHFVLLPSGAADPTDAGRGSIDQSADVGLDVRLLDGRVVVTGLTPSGPAAAAGVRPGWVLQSIDGVPVADALAALPATLPPRLMQVEVWRAATTRLRGPSGSTSRLTFVDGRDLTEVRSIVRRPEPGEPVTVGNLPTFVVRVTADQRTGPGGARVGVIAFNVWMTVIDAQIGEAVDRFRGADGIVLDLRGNPGGLAAMLMGTAGYFLDEPLVLGKMRTRAGELRFAANPRRVNAHGQRVAPYAGPLAILIDAMTGSASECFAGGMQALGRARVFGQPSMGQALPALFDRLPDGDVLVHAYGDFQTALGARLEGRGVTPDEPVALTREDLLAGEDRAMAAALAWIARSRR